MKKRIIRRNGYEVKINSNITINDVIAKVTDEFVDQNIQYFNIEYLIKDLEYYTNKLDSFSYWAAIKENEKRLYWLKVFQLIAYDINKYSKGNHILFFIAKEVDKFKAKQYPYVIKLHVQVRYNLVYFNTKDAAQIAKEIIGDKIKHVV